MFTDEIISPEKVIQWKLFIMATVLTEVPKMAFSIIFQPVLAGHLSEQPLFVCPRVTFIDRLIPLYVIIIIIMYRPDS